MNLTIPDALRDFRTPAFDLDDIYGRDPGDLVAEH